MKIKTTIFTLLTLFTFFCHSTDAQDCDPATAQVELNTNNVNARIKNGGDLWWDGSNAAYVVPKPATGQPEVSAFFAGGIWIGGFDLAGNLKLAASTYGANTGTVDYYPGPLTDGVTNDEQCNDFDKIWSTTSVDIEMHMADWNDNGTIDGPTPASILGWPGRGNPEFESIFGFELPVTPQGFAPFFDQNGNGIYEPNSGDYPNINDADQGHWTVFNDAGNFHNESGANIFGIEIQLLSYAYESNDPAIDNATFYDYTFIHKGVETIENTAVGIWIDPDLGCYQDDYVGCSPEDNMAYIYNQDEVDGDAYCNCPGGINTYCEEIPVIGVKILKGILSERVFDAEGNLVYPSAGMDHDTLVETKMSSFMVKDGILGAPTGNSTIEYYRLMTGSWGDGTPLTTGGNGYNPGSTDSTKFTYPGNPASDLNWSMCSDGNVGGDYRMLMGIGTFRMLPGQVKTMSFAVVAALDVPHPCPDISVLQDAGDSVCDFYNSNVATSYDTPQYNESNLTLSPNPMNDQALLSVGNGEELNAVEIYSISGQLLRTYPNILTQSLSIQKGNLTTGMYFYKATTKQGKSYSGKFVVE